MRTTPATAAARWALVLGAALAAGPLRAAEPPPEAVAFFEQRVRPLLVEACQRCHGPKKQESGLRLDSRTALLKGGDSGPALVPGKPDDSLLLRAVRRQGELHMPPSKALTAEQVDTLARWVALGAPWPEDGTAPLRTGEVTPEDRKFWSFQPLGKVTPPAVRNEAWVRTPVDRFILAALEAHGLKPAAPADKRTLIRRATFDLTGLPPTPEEVDAFLADAGDDAFAKVVDRLLASPAYGERWGRHWLDVVRYADTAGETADYPVREAYLYRNYVIDAFNRDRPYDQFVREQVAGDLLAATAPRERYAELVTATGYLALSRRFGFDPQNYQHLTIQDTIDTLGQSVLGLSLGCARCHPHKFDPVSTADYYALYGIFASTVYAFPGSEERKRPADFVPLVPPEEAGALTKGRAEELARLADAVKKLDAERAAAEAELKALPPGSAEPAVKELRDRIARLAAERGQQEQRRAALAAAAPYPVAYAVREGKPFDAAIQKRGEPGTPGEVVPRRFLSLLGGAPVPPGAGSGRLQLAGWLTDPANPLTARVMVNRIWQHHFGAGLVATPNDFGARGRRPTHPELLDHLAAEFIASGWSVKAMHRRLMLSQAYRMSADFDADNGHADPDNRWLWRYRRHRLEAEAIRDALLFLGGNLDRTPGGPHPFPPVDAWNFTQHQPFSAVYETNRRSVYLMTQRNKRHPFLALFDGPDPSASTAVRLETTVPTQALYLMNDPFVHEQSAGFARRLLATPGADGDRLRLAYRLALAREPTAEEARQGLAFLERYRDQLQRTGVPGDRQAPMAWAALARTLLIRNEFLFVE